MSHNRRRQREQAARRSYQARQPAPKRLPDNQTCHRITQELAETVGEKKTVREPWYLHELGLHREPFFYKHKPCEHPPIIRRNRE